MEFRHQQLPNGLEIVAECNPQAYSCAYAFFVRSGSRDENDQVAGVSHFLEHMVFKGTATRSAADVNRELDELSSNSNAFTSEEQTVYYAATLPEDQPNLIQLMADMLRPALRQDDFDTEKKVILEEIAKYDDEPPYNAYDRVKEAFFGGHPLARSVIGSTASVGALTREQMLEYFERRYSPGNIVLAAAGNVDFDRLVEDAERSCGAWQSFEAARRVDRAQGKRGFTVRTLPQAAQEYVMQMAAAPGTEDDDRYAARVLGVILGDDSGSRLFWELVDTGLADYASFGAHEYQGTGVFITNLCCTPEETAANLQRIATVLADAQQNGLTPEELQQAQNKVCAQIVLSAERPASRMFTVGNAWLQRRQYRTIREVVEAYRRVTLDDLRAVMRKYPLAASATFAVGPLTQLSPAE